MIALLKLIDIGRSFPLWVALFLIQGVLVYIGVEKLSDLEASKEVSLDTFISIALDSDVV